jgi:hypothetical protein
MEHLAFLEEGVGRVAALTDIAAPIQPVPSSMAPMPGQVPQETPVTREALIQLAKFSGQLVKSSQPMNTAFDANKAIARMNSDGSISVKVPFGATSQLDLETVSNLSKDIEKGMYGQLKALGLGTYANVGNMSLQAGQSGSVNTAGPPSTGSGAGLDNGHPNLQNSTFVLSFTLSKKVSGRV